MAYELHIERDRAIEIEEWAKVVSSVTELRLTEQEAAVVNPISGEQIVMESRADDVSVEVDGQWTPIFRLAGGAVHFRAPHCTDASDPVMRSALLLASKLNAVVRGDDGDEYDGSDY